MTVPDVLLSVSEAATVAGVSARTVRRWAKSGQVRTRGQGRDRRVVAATLSKLADTADTNGHEQRSPEDIVADTVATDMANGHEAVQLAALVRELTTRLAEHAAVAAMWQERASTLADRLAVAESQMAALTAPASTPTASGEPEPSDPPPEPSPMSGAARPIFPPRSGPWPLPPSSNVRGLAPWLLSLVALVAATVLLVWPW